MRCFYFIHNFLKLPITLYDEFLKDFNENIFTRFSINLSFNIFDEKLKAFINIIESLTKNKIATINKFGFIFNKVNIQMINIKALIKLYNVIFLKLFVEIRRVEDEKNKL